jgi:class 3 adenylate cyclase
LPFALQLSLGGIVASGFVAAWCAMAPVTALVVSPPRRSIGWFIACALSMTLAVALDPYVHTGPSQLAALSLFFFWMNTLGLASLVFGTLYYCNSQSRLAHLESERLLLNILPEVIARRLKSRQGVIADRFDDVCVIFADIVNFTALSAERTPEEIVTMLDKVFAAFDELADRHGLEKIKTIGDAYMVASGIPVPRNDSIEAAVEMALAMQEVVRNVNAAGETPIDLRIGMHAGKVVAGVIGRRKFSYDLWGDTVNTASRMESHGIPGTIQITQALAERIADRYACEPVGTIDVKGKGPMSVYRLMARKQR